MQYPQLPQGFTPEIIKALNLRQFAVLCKQFGFVAVFKRLDWEDFLRYWSEQSNTDETFGEFLRRVGIKI